MTALQRLQLEQSQLREKINDRLGSEDSLTDEQRTELRQWTDRAQEVEVELRAAIVAEPPVETRDVSDLDTEQRERLTLRSTARLTNYLSALTSGRAFTGPEHELCAAAGVSGIPIELFDVPSERREASGAGSEHRAVTPAPGTVGVNLDPIRPAVFANSIAARLGIDMPRVMSGTYATGTITGSQSAAALGKGTDATATAGAITVGTATPKRISARLELAIEDIAAVGQDNFEAILRENLSLALSDALDNQAINGNGTAPNLTGMFERLTTPGAPAAGVADFDAFISLFAGGIEGLWANTVKDVSIVCNPETYRLSLQTFRDSAGNNPNDLGDTSFADYAMQRFGGWWTNKRMPDKASHIAQAILYRMGRSAMGANAGMRTAVCPHWGEIGVDDIYSGSASGQRNYTLHVLLGDVILVQPDAYAQVAVRVSS